MIGLAALAGTTPPGALALQTPPLGLPVKVNGVVLFEHLGPVGGVTVGVGTGNGLTVIVAVPVQPPAAVTVTVYVPDGTFVSGFVVPPFDQLNVSGGVNVPAGTVAVTEPALVEPQGLTLVSVGAIVPGVMAAEPDVVPGQPLPVRETNV